MKTAQIFVVALVAFKHIYFMILELFYWDKPRGLKAFGLKLEEAKISKTLAQNQGLYNGFLAAGLIWAIINKSNFEQLAVFFLSCITIAGIYGAYTTKKTKLFFIQSVPALIGLLLILLNNV
jgi:putative membrane protein